MGKEADPELIWKKPNDDKSAIHNATVPLRPMLRKSMADMAMFVNDLANPCDFVYTAFDTQRSTPYT